MNDKYIPPDSENDVTDRPRWAKNYASRIRPASRLICEAKQVILDTLAVGKINDLSLVFSQLTGRIRAEPATSSPNVAVCRMWETAVLTYEQVSRIYDDSNGDLYRIALITLLEQELSGHLDTKRLFVESVVKEMDRHTYF